VEASTHHATDALAAAICHLHSALPRHAAPDAAASRRIAHA
jgi:Holliday junction resolvasome RuvABC endonuclease subunit